MTLTTNLPLSMVVLLLALPFLNMIFPGLFLLITRRVQEVFHTPDHYYMVMDLYTGGDMYARYKFRSEDDTAKIVGKLINALRYCHDRNVAVRPL